MSPDLSQALQNLRPNAEFYLKGSTLTWLDTKQTEPTQSEIDAEMKRMETEFDSQAYARTRKSLYPDIGDQLDDLYKQGAFSSAMAAKIKKVKDDNPKG